MGLVRRKRFGQHFLNDRGVIARIVAAIDPRSEDQLVEIGPGRGALTAALLERVRHLHVIEIDRDITAHLRREFPAERLTVHEGDVLDFDFAMFPPGVRIVGNLPYNISTPILFHVLRYGRRLADLHFMLQREVVDRMAAAPSTPNYGRLSIMLQLHFVVKKLFEVAADAFRPPPKVASAIVRLVPHDSSPDCDEATLARLVTAAFTRRRKTLRNALAGLVDESTLAQLGYDPRLRPENLSVADYVRLTRAVHP